MRRTQIAPAPAPRGSDRTAARRLLTIDALRAVAALSVLLHHLPPVSGLLVVLKPLQAIGYTGVGLFLVLSGFSIHYKWAATRHEATADFDHRKFWRRRFRRLYPSYAAAATLSLVTAIAIGEHLGRAEWAFGGTVPAAASAASQFLLIPTNAMPAILLSSIVWTLGLEIQLYAAYAAIVRRIRRFDPVKITLWALAVTLVWRVGAQFVTTSTPMGGFLPGGETSLESRYLYMQLPARCFEWFLGMLMAEVYLKNVKLPRMTRSVWFGAGVLLVASALARHPVVAATLNGHEFRASNVFLDQLFGLGFFVIVGWATHREAKIPSYAHASLRALAYVGVFSYSIYLVHPIVISVGVKVFPTTGAGAYLGLPACAAAAVLASWVFHLLVERRFIQPPRRTTSLAAAESREPAPAFSGTA